MTDLVFKGQNDQVLTNSLLVAEKFEKRHDSVFRSVNQMIEKSPQKCGELFSIATYIDSSGKENQMYIMNRKGFTLLAMGFTGKKAFDFKSDFYDAFEAMEKALKEKQKPLSQLEILVQSARALLEQSRRIDNVEKRLDAMEQEREENGKILLSVSMSSEELPEISLRNKVRRLVNKYASATNTKQQDVWHKIYDQLYYLYHISVKAYKKEKKETYLDVAERNRFLDKIHIVISNMIREGNVCI